MPLDPKALEAAARGIYEKRHAGLQNVYEWDDSGLDDEHPGHRERYMRDAEAAITAYLAATGETQTLLARASIGEITAKVIYWDDLSPDDLWHQLLKAAEQADGK